MIKETTLNVSSSCLIQFTDVLSDESINYL